MHITTLPSDVRVLILSHLDFPSLSRLVQSHSSFNSVWKSYPEHLSRAICIRNGLADAKTIGSAAPLQSEGWQEKKGLDQDPNEEELKQVIREQRSLNKVFDHVEDWTSYAKTRSTIDRNWNTGKMKQFLIKFDMRAARAAGLPDTEEYWRFKVDPVSGWIIVTGLFGGVYAFETDGKLSWYSTLPAVPFGHLELTYSSDDNSTSYLSTTLTDRNFLIWRYHDPSKSADPESPPPTLNMSSDSLASLTPHYASLDATKRGFHPYTLLVAEDTCGATKLRYPYLLATTRDNLTAYQWNFTDPVPSRSKIDLSRAFAEPLDATENGEMEVSYVELDDDSVFVAGMRSVTIWRPEDESKDQSMVPSMSMQLANWPPLAPPGYRYLRPLVPEPLYRAVHVYNDRPFSAVHHDSKSGFLVGASHFHHFEDHACVLTLTYGYKSAIWSKDREEIEQRTMNLYLTGVETISQLSVENDRAVFVASFEVGHALLVLPLRPFNSLSEFVANPPKPILLSYPLPCVSPPSRIESSSTDIYVPAQTPLLSTQPHHRDLSKAYKDLQKAWIEQKKTCPFPMTWKTLDGQILVDYSQESMNLAEMDDLARYFAELQLVADDAGLGQDRGVSAMLRVSFNV